jgi:cyclophilin family peptidyl-prolyl cis-trans isomerase
MYKLAIQITILLSFFSANLCSAETIVRFSIQQGITTNTVDLKLYDTDKPVTVANFMSYVEDGSYNNSFIHRSVPGFIIQGGGYKYDPNISTVVDGLSSVLTKDAIDNEPGISNLRGTIAMAKLGGDPNSATSQWFFNLDDNSAILDPQNGGFTVFGEVINNGMPVIDSISLIPTYDMGCMPIFGCLDELPLLDYILGDLVLIDTLVKITKVEGLVKISPDYNFGFVEPSIYQQSEFIVENISTQNLSIGNIGGNDPVMPPFGINDTECNNTVLLPGASCVFIVSFNPLDIKVFSDSFNIEFPVLGFDYTVNVSGVSEPGYDFEGDGVSDLIENSGPNNGDGNYDGILDSIQSNIVSVPDINGQYITLIGTSDIRYRDVHFADPFTLPSPPDDVVTPMGILKFTIVDLNFDEAVKTGMILTASTVPTSFYVLGPDKNNPQDSWFEFSPDILTSTGAEIIPGASFTTDDGRTVSGTFVTLFLTNAVRGDADFTADSEISITGTFHVPSENNSGQLHRTELYFFLILVSLFRLSQYRKTSYSD